MWDHDRVTAPALILWDVDHTLLEIKGVSRDIYARAYQLVTGSPMEQLADMTGRTERAIIIETLQLGGITEPEPLLPAFYDALGEAARQLQDRMRGAGRSLPGAGEAIAALVADGVVQSVVTGNLHSIAEVKLAAFGLTEHLDLAVGGYGDDDSDRAVLVRLAVKRAEAAHQVSFPRPRVVVIGGTPHDVKGAHDAGVRAVGVATGGSTVADLEAAGAEAVLPDLTRPRALQAAVFGLVG